MNVISFLKMALAVDRHKKASQSQPKLYRDEPILANFQITIGFCMGHAACRFQTQQWPIVG